LTEGQISYAGHGGQDSFAVNLVGANAEQNTSTCQ
jgi:hypothetical protein